MKKITQIIIGVFILSILLVGIDKLFGIEYVLPDWRVVGHYLHIGDSGTVNYADGDGDVYVEDEAEIDGKTYFGNTVTLVNAQMDITNAAGSAALVMQSTQASGDTELNMYGNNLANADRWRLAVDGGTHQLLLKNKGSGSFANFIVIDSTGGLTFMSKTEAELKLLTSDVGSVFYDSTNKAVVISTGTAAGDFGMIYDGATAPTGW